MQIFPHSDVGMRIKNLFVGESFVTLQSLYMHKQRHNTREKGNYENISYDPFKMFSEVARW